MKTLESKGTIRRIIEENGEFLVSFPTHDGYFKAPEHLRAEILKAQAEKREITFSYDRELNILKVA